MRGLRTTLWVMLPIISVTIAAMAWNSTVHGQGQGPGQVQGAAPVTIQGPLPVPVSVTAPTLRNSADTITGTSVAIPAGIVATDFVFSSGDADCTTYVIGSFTNPGGTSQLALIPLPGQKTVELHLATGVRSTTESPLRMFVQVNCSANVFWSGYEG